MRKKVKKSSLVKSAVVSKLALGTKILLIITMVETMFVGYAFAAMSVKDILNIKPTKQSTPVPELVFTKEDDGNLAWDLVWQDEFDYEGLPDATKWDFEEGYVRNNEPQYYTRADIDNAYVHDGYLSITTLKDKERQYTSASLITLNKAHFIYGVFEIRAKLPAGSGSWPTFWLLGKNVMRLQDNGHLFGLEEHGGEIDIMEHWGVWPRQYSPAVHVFNGTDNIHNVHQVVETSSNLSETWHTYKLKWSPDRLDFYFDDHIVYSYHKTADVAWPFDFEHYIILNNALKAPNINPITDFPMEFQVDYVRVYSAKPECGDGLDNDGDGQVDLQDSFCHNEFSLTEHRPECDDGVDNDNDGLVDYYEENFDCKYNWMTELPDCSDGIDNDNDGFIDYPADNSCEDSGWTSEISVCSDGIDNDNDGMIDYPADISCAGSYYGQESHEWLECDNNLDDDNDGFIDYPSDRSCFANWDIESNLWACDNSLDDDNDGFIDYPADINCSSMYDSTEEDDYIQ